MTARATFTQAELARAIRAADATLSDAVFGTNLTQPKLVSGRNS